MSVDAKIRRLTVTAWAFHNGYEAHKASWFDEEGVEAWEWTDPQGGELGGEIGPWDEMPVMPDHVFAVLDRDCAWK